MTSEPTQAYVWVWLPAADEPVVAGRLEREGEIVSFVYGASYLARADAIPLYTPELPLGDDLIPPLVGTVAGCIADAAPDSWGRRIIMNRRVSTEPNASHDPGILTFLLESGSDRIGALDFQERPDTYVARAMQHATLDELAEAADRVEHGVPLSPELDAALMHASSIGGARPKALVRDGDRQLIAKFSSTTDTYAVVKAEFIAMELATRVGLRVPRVDRTQALGRDVLLVERFDRPPGGGRRAMVSAMTILGLTENDAIFGGSSYARLAHEIRSRFTDADATLRELFARITFNILVGNNDDHPRNHAAFWDGRTEMLTLTPAYDVCPQPRAGSETQQVMSIGDDGYRLSRLAGCVERSMIYHLDATQARDIIDHQVSVIEREWPQVCDLADLSQVARKSLWRTQFLNESVFYGY